MRLLPLLFVLNLIVNQQTDHYLVLFLVPVLSIIPVMADEAWKDAKARSVKEFWRNL